MQPTVISAIIAALTALAVMLVTHAFQQSTNKMQEAKSINDKYLNPLRLYLEENYFRIAEILHRIDAGEGRCESLLYINSPEEVSRKDASWFNGEGCYLISSCYFTACLFAFIKKARDDVPYLSHIMLASQRQKRNQIAISAQYPYNGSQKPSEANFKD